MKTKRFFILIAVLIAALGLLTVSLAVASENNIPPEANFAPGPSGAPSEATTGFDVVLDKDDGVSENTVVLRDPNTLVEFHAVWVNWFDSTEATFPFQLERVEYDANTANLTGMDIQILVYSDSNDGSITDATLVYTEVMPVQTQTGTNVYTLTNPVAFNSPTDILIGFSSIYADGGIAWPGDRRPMTLDQTVSQGDSWVGWMGTTGAPVDVTNLASLTNFGTIDSFGLPGNWHNRGYGTLILQQPGIAISKTPASQDVTTNGNADFTITVTNTGDVDLANVNVSDPLVPACDNAIGGLTISQTVSYACQDVGVTGSYTNVVTVTSDLAAGGTGPSASASAVVNFMSPTSVSLTGFGEGGPSATPIWLGALVLLVVGLGLVMRRKLTN
jgi:uncharacterized repeat protein (TIGR01451 family)